MIKKLTLSLLLLVIFTGVAVAQTAKVTGSVTSADDGQPVIGASILVKGTTVGTVTDCNSAFTPNELNTVKDLGVSPFHI